MCTVLWPLDLFITRYDIAANVCHHQEVGGASRLRGDYEVHRVPTLARGSRLVGEPVPVGAGMVYLLPSLASEGILIELLHPLGAILARPGVHGL
jgi:hypothetical protein